MGLVYQLNGRLFAIKKAVIIRSPLYKTGVYKKSYQLLCFYPDCFIRAGSIISC